MCNERNSIVNQITATWHVLAQKREDVKSCKIKDFSVAIKGAFIIEEILFNNNILQLLS